MRFSFDVKLTDKDYLLFNEFHSKNSEMSKKTIRLARILYIITFALCGIMLLINEGVNPGTVVGAILFLLAGLMLCLCAKKMNVSSNKTVARMLIKGKSKKPYTPESTLEFYDDFFKEIAPDNRTESNYTAIDRICVVMNSYVFIFIDSMRGYMVPFNCFKDADEEKAFLAFLGTLTPNIEFFDKI